MLVVLIALLFVSAAMAQAPGGPIPEEPDSDPPPTFIGEPAVAKPVYAPELPRHPFMAPNGRSNIHSNAFMTDTNVWSGPLGHDTETLSTFHSSDCASVTFDSQDRIVTICVGIQRPRLKLFDPRTLEELASMDLPAREPNPGGPSIFQDFAGGGYFYLDHQDRSIIPTTNRHLYVVSHASGSFALEQDIDLNGAVASPDKIISALPDWSGLVWFASTAGIVGTVDLASGRIQSFDTGEENQNSFTVGDEREVYIVTEQALYRFEAAADGTPRVVWRTEYPNSGVMKPGQVSAGSGTTPTVHGDGWVSITDNAEPMHVVSYRRADGAQICRQPVFDEGSSATDNTLIGAGHSIIVENNYGYTGPPATMQGRRTTPGIERIDIDRDGSGCRRVWRSDEASPTVVPKLSLANGLIYVYTQDKAGDEDDPWYLTALDFRTGETVWKRLTGQGLGFNNNYAPVTIGPDGTAYIGVLGGLTLVRDGEPPAQNAETRPRLRVRVAPRRLRGGRSKRVRVRVRAPSGGVVAPVAGATIRIDGRVATTDARGRARLRIKLDRRIRRQPVRAVKSGYRAGSTHMRVGR